MKAIFERKPDFTFQEFVIEKTVTVPDALLKDILKKPLSSRQVIAENAGLMGVDKEGVYHCLFITGKGRTDGLLVESEGCEYARYAAYVPEGTAMRYPTLLKVNQELASVADLIIEKGTSLTAEGNWSFTFEELEEWTGICLTDKPFLQEILGDMLCSRPEVADLVIEDGQVDVTYYHAFCPNCQRETAGETAPGMVTAEEMQGCQERSEKSQRQGMFPSI